MKRNLINFEPPPKLLEAFDERIKPHYKTRSAALCEAMRMMIRHLEEQERVALVAEKQEEH